MPSSPALKGGASGTEKPGDLRMSTLLRQYLACRATEASAPVPEPEPFSRRAVRAILEAPGLQRREGQLRMAELVAQVLAGERRETAAAIEAGTGTGKSLAYLVPVMMHCVETGKRAVVATATKTLQEQIIRKDAPFVAEVIKEATGKSTTFAVLFGKGNYLCPVLLRKRLAEIGHLATLEVCYLERLAAWLETGGSGLRDDLPAFPDMPEVQDWWWARVSAEDDEADCSGCLGVGCAFKKRLMACASFSACASSRAVRIVRKPPMIPKAIRLFRPTTIFSFSGWRSQSATLPFPRP